MIEGGIGRWKERLENWKIGKLENWGEAVLGRLESWKVGRLEEDWMIRKLENWKIRGKRYSWSPEGV